MYIRYEFIKDTDRVLILDELERYLGETNISSILDLIDDDKEDLVENDYLYYFVDKQQLNLCFQSFSRQK